MEATQQHFVIDDKRIPQTLEIKINITALYKSKDPRVRQLLNDAYSVQAQAEELTQEINADNLAAVKQLHIEARAAAKAAKLEFQTATNQTMRYTNLRLQAENKLNKAQRALKWLREDGMPQDSDYPSEEDIAAYKQRLADDAEYERECSREQLEANNDYMRFMSDLKQYEQKFESAAALELELRNKRDRLMGKKVASSIGL